MFWKIGEYQVQRELARGGAGIIYLAHDPNLGRDVAVKVLQRAPHERAIQRFQTEARSLARLVHPHIVRVHAAGDHEGYPYFVMDFVPGASLQERLRMGALDPDDAAALIHKLARAVDYAHRQGVLHRDIKPANVIVDLEGEPRLADFGLAKAADLNTPTPLSVSGRTMGTLGYCSPEQATGELPLIGPPTDVYGLGATLYAALTMQPPIEASSELEVLTATCQRKVQAPSSLNPAIPPELDAICLRALAKSPHERYATAAEFAEAIKDFLARRTELAGARTSRPALWALAALVVAGLLMGMAYRLGQAAPPPTPSPQASTKSSLAPEPTSSRAVALLEPSPTLSPSLPAPSLAARTRALLLENEVAAAEGLVQAALAKDPADFEGLVAQTELLIYRGEHQENLDLSTKLLRQDPTRSRLRFNRGFALVELKRFAEGVEEYTACVERGFRLRDAVFNRAIALRSSGHFDEALADCDRLAARGQPSPRLHLLRGECLKGLRRYREAIQAYESFVEFLPREAHAWFSLGLLRVQLNRLPEAIQAYTQAIDAQPRHPWALYNRGMIKGAQGDLEGALRDLEGALDLVPTAEARGRLERRIAEAKAGDTGAFVGD